MQFTCSQSDFNSNLSLVNRAIPSRPTNPILANVLLIADEEAQKINLTAFDSTLGIYTSFNAEITEGGSLTIPAKLVSDIVSRLSEGEITISMQESDNGEEDIRITLASASGQFQFRGISATDYPELPTVDDGEKIVLPVSLILEGLRGSAFAASVDETKQILSGVHLRSQEPNCLEFAATDGHRLSVVSAILESEAEDNSTTSFDSLAVTIPARALRELEKMLSSLQPTDTIDVRLNESQIMFDFGDRRLTSRILEGAYPAYQQLIPRQFARQVTVERKRLISSLELVAVLADQKNNIVKFSLDGDRNQLILSVEAQDVGKAKQSMPAEILGGNLDIAFNIKYLMDGLKALSTADIKMQLNEWNQPVIFNPLGGAQMTYLVMPVQIRN
jgi:DNA polymerase-3 subunit beta